MYHRHHCQQQINHSPFESRGQKRRNDSSPVPLTYSGNSQRPPDANLSYQNIAWDQAHYSVVPGTGYHQQRLPSWNSSPCALPSRFGPVESMHPANPYEAANVSAFGMPLARDSHGFHWQDSQSTNSVAISTPSGNTVSFGAPVQRQTPVNDNRQFSVLKKTNRSHEFLKKLDSHYYSYPGWQEDYQYAEYIHDRCSFSDFASIMQKLVEKQKVYEGHRSQPQLVALGTLTEKMKYPGINKDRKGAENIHLSARYEGPDNYNYFEDRLRWIEFQGSYEQAQTMQLNDPTKSATKSSTDNSLEPCVVCEEDEKPRSHAFVPCGHLCCCEGCAGTIMSTKPECPLCRNGVTDLFRIFIS